MNVVNKLSYIIKDFEHFKKFSDEKNITINLSQLLNNNLKNSGVIFNDNIPIKVADIACGPADTIIRYLTNIEYVHGFDLRLIDHNPLYTSKVNDYSMFNAYHNIKKASNAGTVAIKNYLVKHNNAFEGNLHSLLTYPDEGYNIFKMIYVSYGLYSIKSQAYMDSFIHEITNTLLAQDGIIIMYNPTNTINSFQDFRNRYNHESNGKKNKILDITESVKCSCKMLKIPILDLPFEAKLFFSLEIERDKVHYECNNNFSFIAPKLFKSFNNNNILVKRYIEEVCEALKVDKIGRRYLPITEQMQILLHPASDRLFRKKIIAAYNLTRKHFFSNKNNLIK